MTTTDLQMFVDTVRLGSFANVARQRDVDPSTVSRTISALEDEIGVRLFQRTTRRLTPTEAGLVYFERIQPLVDELRDARQAAVEVSQKPTGTLRVTAPVSFAQRNLVPSLPFFAQRYPDVRLELLLTDARVDLLSERLDVAIRLGRLADSTLVATRLRPMRYAVCASPEYLRQGRPETPSELAQHRCLTFPLPGYRFRADTRWRFRDDQERATEVDIESYWAISNAIALKQSALAGVGIALLATWVIGPELSSGALVDLFPALEVTATEFDASAWLLYPSRNYLPLKVRVFADFVKNLFADGMPGERC